MYNLQGELHRSARARRQDGLDKVGNDGDVRSVCRINLIIVARLEIDRHAKIVIATGKARVEARVNV